MRQPTERERGVMYVTDTQTSAAPLTCMSDVTSTMLIYLALLQVVTCFEVQVEGELAFDLRVPNRHGGKERWFRVGWEAGSQLTQELVFHMSKKSGHVTAAPRVKCVYQYPEKKQVDALLSNMMNELTKIFVRANEYMNSAESRWRSKIKHRRGVDVDDMDGIQGLTDTNTTVEQKVEANVEEKVVEKLEETKQGDRDRTRFKIVHEKQTPFFESIYNDMTHEYRKFYNTTFERVYRSASDPCTHQEDAERMWRELLQHGQDTLRRAAQRCLDEYLKDIPAEKLPQMRTRLKLYLKKKMGRVRANQLVMLCDSYQLCYNDLLKDALVPSQ